MAKELMQDQEGLEFFQDLFDMVTNSLDRVREKFREHPTFEYIVDLKDRLSLALRVGLPQDKIDLLIALEEVDDCEERFNELIGYLAGFQDRARLEKALSTDVLVTRPWGATTIQEQFAEIEATLAGER